MGKYMGDYYWTRTDHDLAVLRSKKYNRLAKLRKEPMTYFNKREIQTLTEQMANIDAVLQARRDQTEMFKDL